MRVPARFHNGEWNETDDWMEAHPAWTYFLASLLIIDMLILSSVVFLLVFHP